MAEFFRSGITGPQGDQAVDCFINLAKKNGYESRLASTFEDWLSHFDLVICKENIELRVDVKAKKYLSRGSNKILDDMMWIELRNVAGNPGWLYGRANIIAQQFEDYFLLINRILLKEFIESRSIKERVTTPQDALYKIYSRAGRKDEITLVNIADFPEEIFTTWKI